MPLIETKGAASAQGFGGAGAGASGLVTYIEDVFSTWLYTGNGSTQTITNGIDLSGKGGLVWIKGRSGATDHALYDTARGATKDLVSNSTAAETTQSTGLTAFNGTGFSIGALAKLNTNAATYASWTFRKQPKFFDVVTFTSTASTNQRISHSLGSVPGCIIVKAISSGSSFYTYHSSLGRNKYLQLNDTAGELTITNIWGTSNPTSTDFGIDGSSMFLLGTSCVAYLFAHNAGGFGLSGTDNVISCGSYTGTASSGNTVTLGYEPQWVLVKGATNTFDWYLMDNMRGISETDTYYLAPNTSAAESNFGSPALVPTATGFRIDSSGAGLNASGATYIYIAIRRGPMKVPTSGTSVFNPVVYTGTNVDNRLVDMSLLTDMTFARQRDSTTVNGMVVGDRLRGDPYLLTASTNAENADADSFMTPTVGYGIAFSSMVGFGVGNDATSRLNISTTSNNQIAQGFRRAPGFFDEVCYTGTGSATTVSHNLTVVPQLIIAKKRSAAGSNFLVYSATIGATKYLILNGNNAEATFAVWNDTAPTSSVFSVGTDTGINASGATYVAYLFATVAGVSKVGSYTGTGTTLQVDCGFTGGARFVLIKRTDSTGDWYVWDSARGIVSGNDPYLLLNSTAAEVTNTDYVDTYSAGFEISSTAPAAINANGGTYIFLAIA